MKHGDIDEQDIAQFANAISTLIGAGVLTPDEGIEEHIRRVLKLPEKLETAPPVNPQPGEDPNDPNGGETPESKSVYKITSILDKYRDGKITRDAAADLLESIGIAPEKIEFHLSQADQSRTELEQKKQEAEKQKAQDAAQKPGKGAKKPPKRKQEETPEGDEEDAQKAAEARKSLGRSE
jgi:hypothetical protein